MGYILLKIFAVICFITLAGTVKFRCDYKYSGIGWFKYHSIPMTWRDARFLCHLEGTILASPTTAAIKNKMISYITYNDIFIGMHSTLTKGQYYTIDGISLTQIPHTWADSEPDNKNNTEDCLTMNADGKIADVNCNITRPFVCYRENSNKDVNICGTIDPEYHFDSRTNKCYKFHTNPRKFHRANFACSAEGGHLAIINSEEESRVIVDIYAKYPDSNIPGNFRKDIALIGFHNWGESVDWTTIHGQSLQEAGFSRFDTEEPNNSAPGEECGSVYRNGLFNDVWCDVHFPFICEKKPDFPPVCDNVNEEFVDLLG